MMMHGGKRTADTAKASASEEETKMVKVAKMQHEALVGLRQFSPASAHVQVVQSGSDAHERVVYLRTDNNAYLFNCGEGTQRLMSERSMGMTRLSTVFLTRHCWSRLGGLPGVFLHAQTARCPSMDVYGTSDVQPTLDAIRPYNSQRIRMAVKYHVPDDGHVFNDGIINVKCQHLLPAASSSSSPVDMDDTTSSVDAENARSGMSMTADAERLITSSTRRSDLAIAYTVALEPKPGKMDITMCRKLGVPFGPLIGELQRGDDVTLKDGTIVRSADVLSAANPPERFLLVDCPTAEHAARLIDQVPNDNSHDAVDGRAHQYDLVVHMSDEAVVESAEYRRWMEGLSPATRHMFVNDAAPSLPHLEGANRLQRYLRHVDEGFYPPLKQWQNLNVDTLPPITTDTLSMRAEPMLLYKLRPSDGFERHFLDEWASDETVDEDARSKTDFAALKAETHIPAPPPHLQYPICTMLGSGSATPSKYRNVSCIFLRISETVNAMFDCGEASYGQLCEHYGMEGAEEHLKRMRYIFVSHLHQDHYLGVITILRKRHAAYLKIDVAPPPLYLHCPPPLMGILSLYTRANESLGLQTVVFIATKNAMEHKIEAACKAINAHSIETHPVRHAMMPNALFLRLRRPDSDAPLTIVYSGDTLPCNVFAEKMAREDVHLLIHEATLDDADKQEAMLKKHSMMSDALLIARDSKARHTLLTHFSARFSKLPIVTPQLLEDKVGIANDHLEFSVPQQSGQLHLLVPLLRCMFDEEHTEALYKYNVRRHKVHKNEEKEKKLMQKLNA